MWWVLAIAVAAAVPEDSAQLVLVVAPDADSSVGTLTRWSRTAGPWEPVGLAVPVRLGAQGLAWGRGLHPPQPGRQKVEGDDRSPAGVFRIGDAYGDALAIDAVWPYHPVGPRDLWFEDPASPLYNVHQQIPGDRPLTAAESAAVMRQGDAAHALKVFVAHNAPPDVVAGAGSAIFLHALRPKGSPTSGCTAMPRADLDALVQWLEPASRPVLVVLSEPDRAARAEDWGLPTP